MDKKEDTYKKAWALELVPSAIKTKTQYEKNEEKIIKLEQKLDKLTKTTDHQLLKQELKRKDNVAEMESQIKGLERQYSRLSSKYKVLTENWDDGFLSTQEDLQRLATYFLGVNLKKLKEVESFHRKLHNILDMEMNEEAEGVRLLIETATVEIQKLQTQLSKLGKTVAVSQPFLEKYSEIERKIAGLRAQNESFNKKNLFKGEKEKSEKTLL